MIEERSLSRPYRPSPTITVLVVVRCLDRHSGSSPLECKNSFAIDRVDTCLQLGAGPLNFREDNEEVLSGSSTVARYSYGCPPVDASGEDDFRCFPLMLSYNWNRRA
jgi:hypothetical protein